MAATNRTNHWKDMNVLHIVLNQSGEKVTLKYSKSDLRRWFEKYKHSGDYAKTDFNTFWGDIRGKECDYILQHYIKPIKPNNGHWYGWAAVVLTVALIISAIKFNTAVLSFFKNIVISF
jgi:hypothetical protein